MRKRVTTNLKVYQMPGAERLRWYIDGKQNYLFAAPDFDNNLVVVHCRGRIELSKAKAMQLADMLVDMAEQLPD